MPGCARVRWPCVDAAPGNGADGGAKADLPVTVTSQLTGDVETFTAVETGPNTGLFRIQPDVPTANAATRAVAAGDGVLEVLRNDLVTATITACGGVSASATTTLLIDPSGVVYDSRSNSPLTGAVVQLIDVTGASNGGHPGEPASVLQIDGSTAAPSFLDYRKRRLHVPAGGASGTHQLRATLLAGFVLLVCCWWRAARGPDHRHPRVLRRQLRRDQWRRPFRRPPGHRRHHRPHAGEGRQQDDCRGRRLRRLHGQGEQHAGRVPAARAGAGRAAGRFQLRARQQRASTVLGAGRPEGGTGLQLVACSGTSRRPAPVLYLPACAWVSAARAATASTRRRPPAVAASPPTAAAPRRRCSAAQPNDAYVIGKVVATVSAMA